MGNCLRSNKVMAQDELYSPSPNLPLPATEAKKVVEDKPAGGSAMAKPRSGARGKKVVRFKLQEDENSGGGEVIGGISGGGGGAGAGSGSGGVLRIKVVVSQKELKQILKDRENNSCSLEELIAELKVKGRTSTIVSDHARTDEVEVENENGSRRPALKSIIPEDLH